MKRENRGKRGTFRKVVCPWLEFVSESGIKLHAQVLGQHSKVLHCLTSCVLLTPLTCERSLQNSTADPYTVNEKTGFLGLKWSWPGGFLVQPHCL